MAYTFHSQLKVSNTEKPKLKWVMTTHYTNSDSLAVVPHIQEKGAHEGRKKGDVINFTSKIYVYTMFKRVQAFSVIRTRC